MPSQQLELKSDITNLFKDLESIAKDTKVNAPHVPKIEQADITELFSGLNEAHEEAKIEVELRLSLEEKNELDIITNLADTFSEITKPTAQWPNEQPPEHYPKPVDESAKLQELEEHLNMDIDSRQSLRDAITALDDIANEIYYSY